MHLFCAWFLVLPLSLQFKTGDYDYTSTYTGAKQAAFSNGLLGKQLSVTTVTRQIYADPHVSVIGVNALLIPPVIKNA